MTVYLIHFDQPYTSPNGRKTIQHYLGSTKHLKARMDEHKSGRGARLMEVITAAGIPWRVVCTWKGGRQLERQLKRQHNSPRLCKICRATRTDQHEKRDPHGND